MGITLDMVENTTISDKDTMMVIKFAFRTRFEVTMTNILKLVLQQCEETLACIITGYYDFILDEDMLIKALENDFFEWLMFVWAFGRNFIGPRDSDTRFQVTF